jgi:hypothetical protein
MVALGRKTGGRKAGTPNKRTVALTSALAERLEALDFCPVEALIRVGQAAEQAGELDLARAAFADVAPFVYPRKKAVEHAGDVMTLEKLVLVATGVPRGPNDPAPAEAPKTPVRAAPERFEPPSPADMTPEAARAPAPAAARPAGLPRITALPRRDPLFVAEPVPAERDNFEYDPFVN